MRVRIIGAAVVMAVAIAIPAQASVTPRPPCDGYHPGGVRFPTTKCLTTYLYMYGLTWKHIGHRSAVAKVRKVQAEGSMQTTRHARVRFSNPWGYQFPHRRDHLIYCTATYRNSDGDLTHEDLCTGAGV